MNYKKLISAVVLSAVLAACSSIQSPEHDGVMSNEWTYFVEGVETSLSDVKTLVKTVPNLYYITPPDTKALEVHIFTNYEAFAKLKAQYDHFHKQGIQSQGLCIAARTHTIIYDLDDFDGDSARLAKGTRISDLGGLTQIYPTPSNDSSPNWDNDINSLKARDCKDTYLYLEEDYLGTFGVDMMVIQQGQEFPSLPYPFSNSVTSIIVEN